MIMCVPNIFDRVGLEEEVIWHLKDIKKSLKERDNIFQAHWYTPSRDEDIVATEQTRDGEEQSRDGSQPKQSGWISAERMYGLHGCGSQKGLEALVDTVGEIQQDGSVSLGSWTKFPDGCELQWATHG
jgi:hypothetical protein